MHAVIAASATTEETVQTRRKGATIDTGSGVGVKSNAVNVTTDRKAQVLASMMKRHIAIANNLARRP